MPETTSKNLQQPMFDLFVVGGGINGAGIAAEAAAAGVNVALCEKNDFGSATSSASSKLIHGGLRYLEHYEFRLVREALAEREVLLKKAPHLIEPLRFVLPHQPHLRPTWMIRAGLWLYDWLSPRSVLPGSSSYKPALGNPLKTSINKVFEYSDCRVDDARLVIANLQAAEQHGAVVMARTQCVSAKREQGGWRVELEDSLSGARREVFAKALVNAAGPWAQQFIEDHLQQQSPQSIRLIKGSHLVVPKMYEGDQAYILQNDDQRIVFVIPYYDDFTMIGTTDKVYEGNPSDVAMDDEERRYLLNIVNHHFDKPIAANDIVWDWSGVRPLCDDESDSPSAMTRDYTLNVSSEQGGAPLLSVFGGKITTYRKLAKAAMKQLQPFYKRTIQTDTSQLPLAGGDIRVDWSFWLAQTLQRYPAFDAALITRLAKAYGTAIHELLKNASSEADLGRHFGAGLYEREVIYLCTNEWALEVDDIIWRRSKLGLYLSQDQINSLTAYLKLHHADLTVNAA